MTAAVTASETSVSIYQTTWRNVPEESHLRTSRKNLTSHNPQYILRRSTQSFRTNVEILITHKAPVFQLHSTLKSVHLKLKHLTLVHASIDQTSL